MPFLQSILTHLGVSYKDLSLRIKITLSDAKKEYIIISSDVYIIVPHQKKSDAVNLNINNG